MHSNDNGFSHYDILVLRDASGEIGVPGLQAGDLLDEVRVQLYRAGLISLTSGNITDAGWAVLRDASGKFDLSTITPDDIGLTTCPLHGLRVDCSKAKGL